MSNLIDLIKKHEGFVGNPYIDSQGNATIGYGTKLPITEKEAELLLKHRLNIIKKELLMNKNFIKDLPENIQEVLYEMAYQLGVPKLLRFKKMWKAIENKDWDNMIKEMKDSLWYKQTPNRVEDLINKVKNA